MPVEALLREADVREARLHAAWLMPAGRAALDTRSCDDLRVCGRPLAVNETEVRLQATCWNLKRSLAAYIRRSEVVVVRGGVEPPTFRFSVNLAVCI